MNTLEIHKKSLKTWLHSDSVLGQFIISKFYFNADNLSFQIVEQGQSKRVIYNISDITLYDDTDGSLPETFGTITELSLRLEELNYPAFFYDGSITSISGLIQSGTNVTITGSGTLADPYVINSSGGSGTPPTLQEVTDVVPDGNKTTNPIKVAELQLFDTTNLDYGSLSLDGNNFSFKNYLGLLRFLLDGSNGAISVYSDYHDFDFTILSGYLTASRQYVTLDESGSMPLVTPKTSNFTAVNGVLYTTNGTIIVTDPDAETNKAYTVLVTSGTTTIDGVGYTAGALVYRYYNGSVWTSVNYKVSATDIDALKRDGSNANATLDLQAQGQGVTGSFVKGAQIEINTAGDSKKGIIRATNLTTETNFELPENGGAGGTLAVESYVDSALALKQDKVTGVSDTEIGYLDGVTSAIQTQLSAKVSKWQSAVDGTSVANTLTITPTYSQLIPAGTFVAGDVVKLEYRWTSPGAKTSATSAYIYVNTSNSLSGATQLAINTGGATGRTLQTERMLSVKGATTKTVNPATSASTDVGGAAAMTAHTIDWTVDQYILFAIGHSVADQTSFGDFYKITK